MRFFWKILGFLFLLLVIAYCMWELRYGPISDAQMKILRATVEENRKDPESSSCRGRLVFNQDGSLPRWRLDEYNQCLEQVQKKKSARLRPSVPAENL